MATDVATLIAWSIGASIPGCLIYGVVQAVRRKPTTAKGIVWVVGISCSVALPGMMKREREHPNALESQAALLKGIQDGCGKIGLGPERCMRISSCTITRLEAQHPTDVRWASFAERVAANEAQATQEIVSASQDCGSKY